MPQSIPSVIIPAAGQGTRLLPVTKATAKELLPVYDRPVLQFALDEAVAAGARRVVIVISPSKEAIREYVRTDPGFLRELRARGKEDLAALLSSISLPSNVELLFADQDRPLGLGHAVLSARDHVLPGPVGIILPDDVILGEPCLPEMAQHYERGHMVAAMEVSAADTRRYGIFVPAGDGHGRVVAATGMVEKPDPAFAPSRLAAVGRYVLDPRVFRTLAGTKLGAGGEVQLTDAIAADAAALPLTAFRFSGERYDCGCYDGLLMAGVARQMLVKRARVGTTLTAAE